MNRGHLIVRLNETYTVSWSLIKISYTINTLRVQIEYESRDRWEFILESPENNSWTQQTKYYGQGERVGM